MVEGTDVVDTMELVPVDKNDKPLKPLRIKDAGVIELPEFLELQKKKSEEQKKRESKKKGSSFRPASPVAQGQNQEK